MPTRLLLAPAAAGKTAFALDLARARAAGLRAEVRLVVPTALQAASCRRRLAARGGALGVRVFTFDDLTAHTLEAAGVAVPELPGAAGARLLRTVLERAELVHFHPLVRRPGFAVALRELFAELQRGRVAPADLAAALADMAAPPRLTELAQLYAAYRDALAAAGWTDRAGLLWLAGDALAQQPDLAADWPLLIADGFDQFDTAQLELLRQLAARVGELVITLTDGAGRLPRYETTRRRLEKALGVTAAPLPDQPTNQPVDGRSMLRPYASSTTTPAETPAPQSTIHNPQSGTPLPPTTAYVEAPDRAGEVRAALRWLKARQVEDGLSPNALALLARDLAPYRSFVTQIAAEFGLPLHLIDGLPLAGNPAVSALLALLRLVLPAADGAGPALPRRETVAAWRSPFFAWERLGIAPGDADRLDAASRHGLVLGGLAQWREALDRLARLKPEPDQDEPPDLEEAPPTRVPVGAAAAALRAAFDRFVQRLTPLPGPAPLARFASWLEGLIGADADVGTDPDVGTDSDVEPVSLALFARARLGDPALQARDVAALLAFCELLGGLVQAEAILGSGEPMSYGRFLDELSAAVEGAVYRLPPEPGAPAAAPAILAGDVISARGLPFTAVAVLGLAEGVFPAPRREDPFLRDADRARLAERGLSLDPSTLSAEREFFHEAMTRASGHLLLTRPRLDESGADWLASPFWDEARRDRPGSLRELTTGALPAPAEAASWPELLAALAATPGPLPAWLTAREPEAVAALERAAAIVRARAARDPTPHDGDLADVAPWLAEKYGPDHVWSPSRLEQIHTCGYLFFIAGLLDLQPRPEPAAGLEAIQLGTIFHEILEALYRRPEALSATGDEMAALVAAVATPILDTAPRRGGFRETAWWRQTREAILANIARSAQALNEQSVGYRPIALEARFGLDDAPPLTLTVDGEPLRVRGVVDRIDRDEAGQIRIVDYKTPGPSSYTMREFEAGKRLQLPLYALAARDAPGLGDAQKFGEVADGFYWHISQAEPSRLRLAGNLEILEDAVNLAWDAVQRARAGAFGPEPPAGGCPAYCPAAAFCHRYRPGF